MGKFAVINALENLPDIESGDKFDVLLVVEELLKLKKIGEISYELFISFERDFGPLQGYIKEFQFHYYSEVHMAARASNPEPVMFFVIHRSINEELQYLKKVLL